MVTWLCRGFLVSLLTAAVLLLLPSAPASAHAELLESTPANGARLARPPAEVTLTFTESVHLIDGGVRLVDSGGHTVSTKTPVAQGHTVRWPMPSGLDDGRYLVDWRVLSADGHPGGGGLSFGVGGAGRSAGARGGPPAAAAPAPGVGPVSRLP